MILLKTLVKVGMFIMLVDKVIVSLVMNMDVKRVTLSRVFRIMKDNMASVCSVAIVSVVMTYVMSLIGRRNKVRFVLGLVGDGVGKEEKTRFKVTLLTLFISTYATGGAITVIVANPVTGRVDRRFSISPEESTSLLSVFASMKRNVVPCKTRLLSTTALAKLAPLRVVPGLCCPLLVKMYKVLTVVFLPRDEGAAAGWDNGLGGRGWRVSL